MLCGCRPKPGSTGWADSPCQHGAGGTGMTLLLKPLPQEPPFPCCALSPNRTSLCTGMVATPRRCQCPTGLQAASFQRPQLLRGLQQRSLKTPAAMARCRSRWQPWQKRTAAHRGTALTPLCSFRSGSCGESWMRTATWHPCETNLKQVKYCLSRQPPGLGWLHFFSFYISCFSSKMALFSYPARLEHSD